MQSSSKYAESSSKYAENKGVLYLQTGFLSQESVEEAFRVLIEQLKENGLIPENEVVELFFNTLQRAGTLLGVMYAHVNNSVVYNIIIGNNPDGSSRTESVPDPNWVEPDSRVSIGNWGDAYADEQPMIEKKEPPIAALPDVVLSPLDYSVFLGQSRDLLLEKSDEKYPDVKKRELYLPDNDDELEEYLESFGESEQKEISEYVDRIIAYKMEVGYHRTKDSNDKGHAFEIYKSQYEDFKRDHPEWFPEVKDVVTIVATPAYAHTDRSNILSAHVPDWFTDEELKKRFNRFSHSADPRYPILWRGRPDQEGISEFTLTFDPKLSHNAVGAMQIYKMMPLKKGNKSYLVRFDYGDGKPKGKGGKGGKGKGGKGKGGKGKGGKGKWNGGKGKGGSENRQRWGKPKKVSDDGWTRA